MLLLQLQKLKTVLENGFFYLKGDVINVGGHCEHVYMRPEVNSNRFEISPRGKISLRCKVTSLLAFT